MLVEIYDARIRLRPYIESAVVVAVREQCLVDGEHSDEDLEAMVEAARIHAGLAALGQESCAVAPDASELHEAGGGFDGQLAWLARVAQAYELRLVPDTDLPAPMTSG